jgi:hypothetical protein
MAVVIGFGSNTRKGQEVKQQEWETTEVRPSKTVRGIQEQTSQAQGQGKTQFGPRGQPEAQQHLDGK